MNGIVPQATWLIKRELKQCPRKGFLKVPLSTLRGANRPNPKQLWEDSLSCNSSAPVWSLFDEHLLTGKAKLKWLTRERVRLNM